MAAIAGTSAQAKENTKIGQRDEPSSSKKKGTDAMNTANATQPAPAASVIGSQSFNIMSVRCSIVKSFFPSFPIRTASLRSFIAFAAVINELTATYRAAITATNTCADVTGIAQNP
jgi:hypothetical protein